MLRSLESDRSRISHLETQILDLQRAISALETERDVTQARLNAYKYPVLTLPTEIVSEIFIHVLPPYPDCPPLMGLHSPNTLARICSKWRGIALSTPRLWRAIQLQYKNHAIPLFPQVQMFEVWTTRAASCPLSIYIDGAYPEFSSKAVKAVLAHGARIEYLKLHVTLSTTFTAALEESTPLLRGLELNFLTNITALKLDDAPQLRTVVIDGHIAFQGSLPWDKLTSLTLTHVHTINCYPILRQTKNLVHCELRYPSYLDTMTDPPEQDVVLPSLESLSLLGAGKAKNLLAALVVPALDKLAVTEDLMGNQPLQVLHSLISKSQCQLQEVRIVYAFRRKISQPKYRNEFPSLCFTFEDAYPDANPYSEDEDSGSDFDL
ncbi:F-box domain-containing protein [Favolaschia claudopus]|uniref:F-box domain-containing protein n=1 Tax=Favolaschia claudopus TaxID=2862362 RepID=A0AAV9ZDS9_9AGAR